MILKSSLITQIPKVLHGFGTQDEPVPRILEKAWTEKGPIADQIHGVDSADLTKPGQDCGKVDALYTRKAGIPVGIQTADCVPVLLAKKDGAVLAAVHAGWRGTHGRILRALWGTLVSQGEIPSDWVAAVGPAIGPCCYEVSEELALDFEKTFRGYGLGLAVPSHRKLDLRAINEAELKSLGVSQVEVLRYCTRCSQSPRLNSYRREKESGVEKPSVRQWSVLMRGD